MLGTSWYPTDKGRRLVLEVAVPSLDFLNTNDKIRSMFPYSETLFAPVETIVNCNVTSRICLASLKSHL